MIARRMARWRQWLFNRLAQWEEASLARALGLPVERVIFVEVSDDDDRRRVGAQPAGTASDGSAPRRAV